MVTDDAGDVKHTTKADLEVVPVEALAECRLPWEMLSDQQEKTAGNVSYDSFTI